jgi:hypothetical protein
MDTSRETKTLTVGGKNYVVKTYATAREASIIKQAYFKGSKVELIGEQPTISEFNPNVEYEVKLELIRQMVVSVDDSVENIVDRCENLPSDVFAELTAELDALVSKKKS